MPQLSGTSIRWSVWRLAILACGAVGALILVFSWTVDRTREVSNRAEHIQEARNALLLYTTELINAETGQRAYLLTHQDIYLTLYEQALADNEKNLAQVTALLADDPAQAKKLQQLAPIFNAKFAELSQTIGLAQSGNMKAAMAIVLEGRGRRDMAVFLNLRQQMVSTEANLVKSSLAAGEVESRNVLAVAGIFSIFILAFLVAAAAQTVARIEGPLSGLMDAIAALAKGDLNHRVQIRSRDEIGKVAAAFNDMADLLIATDRAREQASYMQMRLSELVVSSVDAIMTKNVDGIISSMNPAAERMFGYTEAEMIGQPITLLIPPDRLHEESQILAKMMDGKNLEQFETIRKRKNGEVFPVSFSISPIRNASGAIVGASKIARDITERHAFEAAAAQSKDNRELLLVKLTESNTELERFAYVASHDMQEPLRMVLNFSQLLNRDYANVLDEEGREYLSIVGESAGRMRDMVRDLLEYARLGPEGMSLNAVDLGFELTHVRDNLTEMIAETKAVITSAELPVICGNAVQMMRLLQNLIANAIKYQSPGQRPLIHIGAFKENTNWKFSIRDNGLGIEPAFIKQIFEPFRRLHSWETIKGTGLGLSVCRKIVENHGGRIWAESSPGNGTTIFFTLPVTEPLP